MVSPQTEKKLKTLVNKLNKCSACPEMVGPVVSGKAVVSPVMLIGQAPGIKEGEFGKPFSWTAGKTLFKWFASTGFEEEDFRSSVYMAAVCRCFPGKNPKGGDRVPNNVEIKNCSSWLEKEFEILKPKLIIPVGKLAILQFLQFSKLTEVVGQTHKIDYLNTSVDCIPLPHPSGASTWHRMEPGKKLLKKALKLLSKHPAYRDVRG